MVKIMTEEEIQQALAFARFNMECEGFTLTEEDLASGREILEGKITADEVIAQIIEKYQLKTESD